jgi:hypothetical protein
MQIVYLSSEKKSYSLQKKGSSHPCGRNFVSLFSPKPNGQSALKFDKDVDFGKVILLGNHHL